MIKKFVESLNTVCTRCIEELDASYTEHRDWIHESVENTKKKFLDDDAIGLQYPPSSLKRKIEESHKLFVLSEDKENLHSAPNLATSTLHQKPKLRRRSSRQKSAVSETPFVVPSAPITTTPASPAPTPSTPLSSVGMKAKTEIRSRSKRVKKIVKKPLAQAAEQSKLKERVASPKQTTVNVEEVRSPAPEPKPKLGKTLSIDIPSASMEEPAEVDEKEVQQTVNTLEAPEEEIVVIAIDEVAVPTVQPPEQAAPVEAQIEEKVVETVPVPVEQPQVEELPEIDLNDTMNTTIAAEESSTVPREHVEQVLFSDPVHDVDELIEASTHEDIEIEIKPEEQAIADQKSEENTTSTNVEVNPESISRETETIVEVKKETTVPAAHTSSEQLPHSLEDNLSDDDEIEVVEVQIPQVPAVKEVQLQPVKASIAPSNDRSSNLQERLKFLQEKAAQLKQSSEIEDTIEDSLPKKKKELSIKSVLEYSKKSVSTTFSVVPEKTEVKQSPKNQQPDDFAILSPLNMSIADDNVDVIDLDNVTLDTFYVPQPAPAKQVVTQQEPVRRSSVEVLVIEDSPLKGAKQSLNQSAATPSSKSETSQKTPPSAGTSTFLKSDVLKIIEQQTGKTLSEIRSSALNSNAVTAPKPESSSDIPTSTETSPVEVEESPSLEEPPLDSVSIEKQELKPATIEGGAQKTNLSTSKLNNQVFSFLKPVNELKTQPMPVQNASNIATNKTTFLPPAATTKEPQPAKKNLAVKSLKQAEQAKKEAEQKEKLKQERKNLVEKAKQAKKGDGKELPASIDKKRKLFEKLENKKLEGKTQQTAQGKTKPKEGGVKTFTSHLMNKLIGVSKVSVSSAASRGSSISSTSSFVSCKGFDDTDDEEEEIAERDTYQLSDEYNSAEDDVTLENKRRIKYVPQWATGANLQELLKRTSKIDPDLIFEPVQSIDLSQIFINSTMRPRTSSGRWDRDHFTFEEELSYKKMMGFKYVADDFE